jgi:hypothetical protein
MFFRLDRDSQPAPLAVCTRAAHTAGVARRAAPYVLAAALQAACAMWPCAAHAQQQGAPGASAAPLNDRQDSTLSAAARQEKSDEQRLLGAPGSSDNPYSATPYRSNGASPEDAEDALTNEKHMHVNVPTGDSGASGARGAASSGGRPVTSRSRIGPNGISRAGNAVTQATSAGGRKGAAGYDYGASATSRSAKIYGNPYGNPYASPDEANAQLYKSPW